MRVLLVKKIFGPLKSSFILVAYMGLLSLLSMTSCQIEVPNEEPNQQIEDDIEEKIDVVISWRLVRRKLVFIIFY